MALTISQRKALAARNMALWTEVAPAAAAAASQVFDQFAAIGQSNNAGNGLNPLYGVTCDAGTAYSVERNPQPRYDLDPFMSGSNPSSHFTQASPWPAFAKKWYDLTGRRSLWCGMAEAGTPLLDYGGAAQWMPEPYATSLVGGYEEPAGWPKDGTLTDFFDTRELHPRMTRGLRIACWCGGEADATKIEDATITGADWEEGFNTFVDHLKATWGFDYVLVFATGRLGTLEAEVDANETASRAELRAAQLAVCTSRSDVILALNTAKEKGTVFNTLTLSGDYWANGWEYTDGQHYSALAYRTMGYTGAWNAAVQLGLTSGATIGI